MGRYEVWGLKERDDERKKERKVGVRRKSRIEAAG